MFTLVKRFFRRIVKDLMYRELLPLKFIFFIHASTILVLYPYLTIHMRELGINVEETAIMSAIIPVIAIVMPPLAGMLADKIGNFRLILAVLSTLVGPVALLLLLVPVGRLNVTYPVSLLMDLSCNPPQSQFMLSIYEESYTCEPAHPYPYQIPIHVESCGFVCSTHDISSNIQHSILQSNKVEVSRFDEIMLSRDYPKLDLTPQLAMNESTASRTLRNMEHFNETVRLIGANRVFFPTTAFNKKLCDKETETCENFSQHMRALVVPSGPNMTFSDRTRTVQVKSLTSNNESWSQCDSTEIKVTINATWSNSSILLNDCSQTCLVSTPRNKMCSNLKEVVVLNISLTFWSYLVIRVMMGIVGGTAFAMFEGAVIAILREHKADYGMQRVYATIGGMISSPLSGWLIDWASQGKDYTDFRPAFWLYAFLKVSTGFLILMIRLDFKTPAKNVVGDVKSVLKNLEMIALLIAVFVLGISWGYIESFLFWLLQDLGGTRSLMGVTITVGGIFGIPLLVISGPLIKRIGHANVLFIGFVVYSIRLFGYSLIYNPWMCLIFEAMEGITSGLAFTAAVTYAAKLSTTTTDTSIQGLIGGLYFGVGKGCGSLIGGFLISAIGSRETYQLFAGVVLTIGIIYVLFNFFYLRKHAIEGNEICRKDKPATVDPNDPSMKVKSKSLDVFSKSITPTVDNYDDDNYENVIPANGLIIDDANYVINDDFIEEEEEESPKKDVEQGKTNPGFEPDMEQCDKTEKKLESTLQRF